MTFISLSYNVLQWIGIFPSHNEAKWTMWAFNVYRLLIFLTTALFTILLSIQMIIATDLTILVRIIDILTMLLSGLYKWYCMTVYNKSFSKLRFTLVQIQAQAIVAYGEPANLFMDNYLKPTRKITLWYLCSGVIVTVCFVASPLFTYPKSTRSELEYFNDPKSFPLSCWIPFTLNERWMFLTIFMCQSFVLLVIMLVYLGIDSFMFGAIYVVGGQIEMLNSSLINVQNYLDKVEDSCKDQLVAHYAEKQQTQCYLILRQYVKHHILILDFIKNVRTLFSSLIIVDYLHGITSLSFALFQLTISDGIADTISVICFISISVWHQFLNNYFGEYIQQKQLSICNAIYNTPWWRLNKKICQLLSLMTLRSLKPTIITGFYMYKLSYKSFISFVKALYTYYMVLRQVNMDVKIARA